MKTDHHSRLLVFLTTGILSAGGMWAQGQDKKYLVRHPYTTELNEKEVIRGTWNYRLESLAVSRSGGTVRRTTNGTIGPFQADTSQAKSLTAASGALATATSNASMSFSQTGGFHQVDGKAAVGGDGIYARAFSASGLALNTGVKRANGKIRWSPTWRVDRIRGSARAGRDPVDLVFRDRVTGEQRSGRLFDVQFAFGEGGSGEWDNGKLSLHGVDGMFALAMDSPYLTSPTGRLLLEFDKGGLVTRSEATGIFAGRAPAIGHAASMDLDVASLTGSADGTIDLAYDFGMEGDLGLDSSFTGDGMAQAVGGIVPATVNDFSRLTYDGIMRPLYGTAYFSNQSPHVSDILRAATDDPYAGFVDIGAKGAGRVSTLAFDAVHSAMNVRGLEAQFDVQIHDAHPHDRGDGVSLVMLPVDLAGVTGPVDASLLSANFSSEQPLAHGALGVGIDIVGDGPARMAQVALSWDNTLLGTAQVPLTALGAEPTEWNTLQMSVVPLDNASHVTLSLQRNNQQDSVPLLQEIIAGLAFPQGVRPVFATTGRIEQGQRGLDNVFISYLSDQIGRLVGDFDANQTLDVGDIQMLFSQLQAASPNSAAVGFDLDHDGQVTSADVAHWIHDVNNSWFGDANLDGQFNSADMIDVFQAGQFEQDTPASWRQGDWTGDGLFNSSDLILAFQDGGYEAGTQSAAAIAAVPEPTSVVLCAIAFLAAAITTAPRVMTPLLTS